MSWLRYHPLIPVMGNLIAGWLHVFTAMVNTVYPDYEPAIDQPSFALNLVGAGTASVGFVLPIVLAVLRRPPGRVALGIMIVLAFGTVGLLLVSLWTLK